MYKMKRRDGRHPTQPLACTCIGTNMDAKKEKRRKEGSSECRAEFKVRPAHSVRSYLVSQSYRAFFGFRTGVRQQRQSNLL